MSLAALAELRHVEAADVYKGEILAGRLQRVDTEVRFEYHRDYLSAVDRPAVARSLPKRHEQVRATGGSLPPFFAGLLPEGVRLTAIATGTRTSLDDHLTLLLAVGQDAVGDVRVVPLGSPVTAQPPLLAEDRVAQTDLAEVFRDATSASGHFDRVALPGVQAKVSAAMMTAPVGTTSGPAILKLNPPSGYPRLVENEGFFLRMAGDCGLPTPQHRLVSDRVGRSGLIVARFDRHLATDGSWLRLAQEDACQLLAEYPAAKYRLKTEDVARRMADTVEEGDGSRSLALRRVFELVVFSYVIGNGDLHGKNFSARVAPDGVWEVTPAYDLISTQPYLAFRDPMALNLYGRANKLNRRHVVDSAQRLGLPKKALEQVIDQILDTVPAWLHDLGQIGLDTPTTERLADLIAKRLREVGRNE